MKTASSIRRKKIVLADQEDVIIEILPQLLKPLGYEIVIARDGKSALNLIHNELPDLIIMDSDLSGLDSFSICQALKEDFLTSYIPIILLIEKRQIRKRILEIKEGVDDYIIKPPDPIDLQVRIEMALRSSEHQAHANSLTRLPGNKAIEHKTHQQLAGGRKFSFMYLDIDRFKSFNDTYGYRRGDGVIMQMAHILKSCVKKFGNRNDFVGHIGGDDFIVMTTPQKEEWLAKEIIKEFDRLMPLHYHKSDREAGYLSVKDRQGHQVKAPLMSLSVSIVNNRLQRINSVMELTETAAEIKKYLKTITVSKFLANRRTSKKTKITRRKTDSSMPKAVGDLPAVDPQTLPVGQILLKAKLITEEELIEALFEHWSSRELLGETLIKMGLITKEELAPFLPELSKNLP